MVDERSRLQLADAAKQVLGDDAGITLMELLPPVGWADVATKHDILALEDRLDARFELRFGGVDSKFGRVDSKFDAIDAKFEAIDVRFDAIDDRFVMLGHSMDGLDDRMTRLETELRAQTWKLMTLMVAVVGVVVAAVRL